MSPGPLYSLFIGAVVAIEPEDRAMLQQWLNSTCHGTQRNVLWDAMEYIWLWVDGFEKLSHNAQAEVHAVGNSATTHREGGRAIVNNSIAWWEALVIELRERFGQLELC